jgi:hypothetical protein
MKTWTCSKCQYGPLSVEADARCPQCGSPRAQLKLSELQNDQVVCARWGRYVEGRDTPKWGSWTDVRLYVQRVRPQTQARGQAGAIAVLTIRRLDGTPLNWAEYGPEDFDPHYNVFESEGYYLEVEGLTA